MKHYLVGAATALALAACAQQTVDGPVVYDLSLYADCGDATASADETQGCTLNHEEMTHALLVSREDFKTSIQVVGDGEAGQLIEVESNSPNFVPALEDLNGDSIPDLLVPKELGNVNTVFAVYLGAADATYAPAGEISGVSRSLTADGMLAVAGRSSAASWVVDYYRVSATALTPVAAVTVEGQQSDPNAPIETVCVLSSSPGITALNLTEAQAQEKFCSDPVAAGVFN